MFSPKHIIPLVLLLVALPSTGRAQSIQPSPADDAKFNLAFRLPQWKTFHLHSEEEANSQVKTLKTLGCEVKTSQHNGHIDLQTRAVAWKLLALDTAEQAKQWEDWLARTGFETLHGHKPTKPAEGEPKEIVLFRLPGEKSLHIHKPHEAAEALVLFKALGCQVSKGQHAGHTDIKLKCPEWLQVDFKTHQAAHAWQNYLIKAGFETQHEH